VAEPGDTVTVISVVVVVGFLSPPHATSSAISAAVKTANACRKTCPLLTNSVDRMSKNALPAMTQSQMIVLSRYPHQRKRREAIRKRHSAGRRAVPNLEGCRSTAMTSGKAEAHVGANESSCCSMNDTKLRFLRGSDNETKCP
jgi:hypothetical protein